MSFLEKAARRWSLGGFACCYNSTAPTPVVDASTSTMNGLLWSGCARSDALMKVVLSFWKASVAAEV